jgi:hypothetical protein
MNRDHPGPPIMHDSLRDVLANCELVAWHTSLDVAFYKETYTVRGLSEPTILYTLRIKGVITSRQCQRKP